MVHQRKPLCLDSIKAYIFGGKLQEFNLLKPLNRDYHTNYGFELFCWCVSENKPKRHLPTEKMETVFISSSPHSPIGLKE